MDKAQFHKFLTSQDRWSREIFRMRFRQLKELAFAEARIEEDLKRINEEKAKFKDRMRKTFEDFKIKGE